MSVVRSPSRSASTTPLASLPTASDCTVVNRPSMSQDAIETMLSTDVACTETTPTGARPPPGAGPPIGPIADAPAWNSVDTLGKKRPVGRPIASGIPRKTTISLTLLSFVSIFATRSGTRSRFTSSITTSTGRCPRASGPGGSAAVPTIVHVPTAPGGAASARS